MFLLISINSVIVAELNSTLTMTPLRINSTIGTVPFFFARTIAVSDATMANAKLKVGNLYKIR
jgi:hypothetical protein